MESVHKDMIKLYQLHELHHKPIYSVRPWIGCEPLVQVYCMGCDKTIHATDYCNVISGYVYCESCVYLKETNPNTMESKLHLIMNRPPAKNLSPDDSFETDEGESLSRIRWCFKSKEPRT